MVAGEHVLLVKGLQLLKDINIIVKNTIRNGGCTALYAIYTFVTFDTVYTIDTVYTVDTVYTLWPILLLILALSRRLRYSYQESQGRKFLISERRLWPLVRSWQGLFKSSCLQNILPVDSEIDVGWQWLSKRFDVCFGFGWWDLSCRIAWSLIFTTGYPNTPPKKKSRWPTGPLSKKFKSEQVVVEAAAADWQGFLLHASPLAPSWNYLSGVPASHFDFHHELFWDTR